MVWIARAGWRHGVPAAATDSFEIARGSGHGRNDTPRASMSHTRGAPWQVAVTIVALATFAIPSSAHAHPRLKHSSPAAGERLALAPMALRLWFSEVPELKLTSLTLSDGAGRMLAIGTVALDTADKFGVFARVLQGLDPGVYTIAWQTAGSDGHPTNGTVAFTVLPSAASGPSSAAGPASLAMPLAPSPTSGVTADGDSATPVGVLHVAVRAITFLSLLVVIGAVVFQLAVLPRVTVDENLRTTISHTIATAGAMTAVLLLLAVVARLAMQVQLLNARPGVREVSAADIVGATRWGVGWMLQGSGALLAVAALLAVRRRQTAWAVAAVAALVLSITPALGGHASASPRFAALGIIADVGHVIGASGWLGSLLMMVAIAVPAITRAGGDERWQHIASLVNVFSPTALVCAGLLAATGLFAAWLHLGSLAALWTSGYGRILAVKLSVLAPLAATGAYNWLKVRPLLGTAGATARLRRAAAVELAVGVVVIGVTAVLVAMEPPIQ
jgi:putative copper export protein/methionine-rich copper-binding protein CopC